MLHLILKPEFNQILLTIFSCRHDIWLFIQSFKAIINSHIVEFNNFLWIYSIIRRRIDTPSPLNNLLSQFIHSNHIAYLQIRPTRITVMCKTMLLHASMARQQTFMTTRALSPTSNPSGNFVNMHHISLLVFSPRENKICSHTYNLTLIF